MTEKEEQIGDTAAEALRSVVCLSMMMRCGVLLSDDMLEETEKRMEIEGEAGRLDYFAAYRAAGTFARRARRGMDALTDPDAVFAEWKTELPSYVYGIAEAIRRSGDDAQTDHLTAAVLPYWNDDREEPSFLRISSDDPIFTDRLYNTGLSGLQSLSVRERSVWLFQHGLTDGRLHTEEETAEEFHIRVEKVRWIESRALRPYVHIVRQRKLKDFLQDM